MTNTLTAKNPNSQRYVPPCEPADFAVENFGTIFLLEPLTNAAREWVAEHIPSDAQTWGNAIAVAHRYIFDIVAGAEADGLIVR